MIIPDRSIVAPFEDELELTIAFTHPFEAEGMDMAKPKKCFVDRGGKRQDLTKGLKEIQFMEHKAWKLDFSIILPGVYGFAVEPEPYWEPVEDAHIIHHTKVLVPAYGDEEGWDRPMGLKTEIIPLTRPFGNYAGNLFQGRVLVDGKPVPHAEVEVEYLNTEKSLSTTSPYHITQVVKADADGVFSFACPWSGWWGFAALTEADFTLPDPAGKEKAVELGAVFWTYMHRHPPVQ
jgi:cobalt/nickel transport protein